MNANVDDNELREFLNKIAFDEQMLNEQQYHQLRSQISLLKTFIDVENKFNEVTSKEKLPSILSELNFAYEFAKLGFKIEMIYDGHERFKIKKNKTKSPDFIAIKDNDEYFIEVTKFSNLDPEEELKKHLEQEVKNYPIYLWVHFSEEYSTPCFISSDYDPVKEKIEILANKIKRVLPDYKSLNPQVEIDGCTIHFNPLPENEQGFIGGCVFGCLVPIEKISDHVKQRLSIKSNESLSWPTSNNPRFYLLALDLEEFSPFPYGLLHLLYGKPTYYSVIKFGERKPQYYYKLKKFLESTDFQSLDDRFKNFLLKVGFDINKETIVNELGIFIDTKDMFLALLVVWWKWYCKIQTGQPLKAEVIDLWLISLAYLILGTAIFSPVTGVLVRSQNSYQYLPNPFSTKHGSDLIDFFNFPILPKNYGYH